MSGDRIYRALFQGLVKRVGGVDAAVAVLEANYGKGCKSTVSKMCSGSIGVTIEAAEALEDAAQSYPITNRMNERRAQKDALEECLRGLAAETSVASGQTLAAVLTSFSEESDDPSSLTPVERANVIAAARETRTLIGRLIDAAEAAEV